MQERGLSLYYMGPREGTPTVSSVFTSWSLYLLFYFVFCGQFCGSNDGSHF